MTVMTDATPMMMPSEVRKLRRRCARMAPSAERKLSRNRTMSASVPAARVGYHVPVLQADNAAALGRDIRLMRDHDDSLSGVVEFDLPAGGTSLWARVDPSVDVEAWHLRALAGKVAFQTARAFTFDGRAKPFARFGFAQLEPSEIDTAIDRLSRAIPGKK